MDKRTCRTCGKRLRASQTGEVFEDCFKCRLASGAAKRPSPADPSETLDEERDDAHGDAAEYVRGLSDEQLADHIAAAKAEVRRRIDSMKRLAELIGEAA